MFARTVTILNKSGLHACPAGLFIETANQFRSAIRVVKGEQEVDGHSILSLMLLEVTPGAEITIRAQGRDEVEAVNALAGLVERRFDEEAPASAPAERIP